MMKASPGHHGSTSRFVGLGLALAAVILAVAFRRPTPTEAMIAVGLGVLLLVGILLELMRAWAQYRASEEINVALRAQLQQAHAEQEKNSADLSLLGNYGNLLLGSTDLAEALQTSQQMLSR